MCVGQFDQQISSLFAMLMFTVVEVFDLSSGHFPHTNTTLHHSQSCVINNVICVELFDGQT